MELSEKIQNLRKGLGLTQEQFAERLFVSRTAVSKWENGRGAPSMDSLRLISKLCSVTLDELLCTDDVIQIAEREKRESIARFAFCVDGIFNILAILSLLLPLYKAEWGGVYYCVPLYQWHGWLAAFYLALPLTMALCGAVELLLCKSERKGLKVGVLCGGYIINAAAIILLILSGQPYPAVMFFALILIKGTVGLITKD